MVTTYIVHASDQISVLFSNRIWHIDIDLPNTFIEYAHPRIASCSKQIFTSRESFCRLCVKGLMSQGKMSKVDQSRQN